MKKILFLTACMITFLAARTQSLKFGPFTFTLPDGYSMSKEKNRALISDPERRICFILDTWKTGKSSIKDNFNTWWNSALPFPEYREFPAPEMSFFKQNGYECAQSIPVTQMKEAGSIKQAGIYQNGSSFHSFMVFVQNAESYYPLEAMLKSMKIDPPPAVVTLSPLEQSYNWYIRLKNIQPSALPIQSYQASGNLNFTGFICPYPEYMQRLGDSLIHLRVLSSLQDLMIGETQLTNNAARHIGNHPTLKRVFSVSQGLTIPLTDAGLQLLSVSGTIDEIDFRSPQIPGISNTGLGYLSRMTQLKSLKLSRAAGITISGIEQLVTLQQLQNLDLSGCTITDADMPRLRALLLRMPRLQSINLTYCGLSQSATNDIRNLRQGFAILY